MLHYEVVYKFKWYISSSGMLVLFKDKYYFSSGDEWESMSSSHPILFWPGSIFFLLSSTYRALFCIKREHYSCGSCIFRAELPDNSIFHYLTSLPWLDRISAWYSPGELCQSCKANRQNIGYCNWKCWEWHTGIVCPWHGDNMIFPRFVALF